MNLKKYFTLVRAGIMNELQYRGATFVIILGNLVYLVVVYFLWKAIFASSGREVVNGMTFESTLIYLVLATTLFNFMELYAVWEIGRNIQTGKIVLDLLRPMSYQSYLFWSFAGSLILNFFTTFLPTFIVVAIVTHGRISFGMNLVYFVPSVVLSVLINYSIDYIVGMICLFTESIWGINIMKQVIVLLFSGVTIPLAFFPTAFKNVAYCLPFRAIYDSPLTLLLSNNPQFGDAFRILGLQLLWAIALTILSKAFWSISIRRITVNGG